jgi:hypothetical protein
MSPCSGTQTGPSRVLADRAARWGCPLCPAAPFSVCSATFVLGPTLGGSIRFAASPVNNRGPAPRRPGGIMKLRVALLLFTTASVTGSLLAQTLDPEGRLPIPATTHQAVFRDMIGLLGGLREKVTADAASCSAPKGALTLGVPTTTYLGDSGSCFSSGVWADIWTLTASGSVRVSFTAAVQSAVLLTDLSAATLASSSDTCGLVPSCTFEYALPAAGSYYVAFGAQEPEDYTITVSSVSGGGGGGGAGINLQPYKPNGWSDKIVVSTSDCSGSTCHDSPTILSTDLVYVFKAILNSGTVACPPMTTAYQMYLDGSPLSHGALPQELPANQWGWWGSTPRALTAGTHTLMIQVDPNNEVAETNESDNTYSKTITVLSPGGGGGCQPSATALCLSGNRYRVTADWQKASGETGHGNAVPLTGDTGYFWFFSSGNVEAVIKVLNACGVNNRYWVFAGGLTNVGVTIRVTDTLTGALNTYQNPIGTAFVPIQDTSAFATCP